MFPDAQVYPPNVSVRKRWIVLATNCFVLEYFLLYTFTLGTRNIARLPRSSMRIFLPSVKLNSTHNLSQCVNYARQSPRRQEFLPLHGLYTLRISLRLKTSS